MPKIEFLRKRDGIWLHLSGRPTYTDDLIRIGRAEDVDLVKEAMAVFLKRDGR